MRTDTFGNPLSAKAPATAELTATQAQRALDAIRLRAIGEGCDLRAFDRLAAPIESVIDGEETEMARAKLREALAKTDPARLRGIDRELCLLADLIVRLSAPRQDGPAQRADTNDATSPTEP